MMKHINKFFSFSIFCLQKAHVQQFVATEDELNKAAEARSTCQKLLKRLYGSVDFGLLHPLGLDGISQTLSNLRFLEVILYESKQFLFNFDLLTLFYFVYVELKVLSNER